MENDNADEPLQDHEMNLALKVEGSVRHEWRRSRVCVYANCEEAFRGSGGQASHDDNIILAGPSQKPCAKRAQIASGCTNEVVNRFSDTFETFALIPYRTRFEAFDNLGSNRMNS